MNEQDIDACLDAVESIFELEAEYIVSGNLVELGALSMRKVEHLNALTGVIEAGGFANVPASLINRLRQVQATASEHGKHLEAMRFGLKRVRNRLGGMQSDTLVGSYGKNGHRIRFTDSVGGFESKA